MKDIWTDIYNAFVLTLGVAFLVGAACAALYLIGCIGLWVAERAGMGTGLGIFAFIALWGTLVIELRREKR